jgi:hypothetical protein
MRFGSRSRLTATLMWLRSASEVWDRPSYHPIGLGDPDPRFAGPSYRVIGSWRPSVFRRPTRLGPSAANSFRNPNASPAVAPTSGFNPTWPAKRTTPIVDSPDELDRSRTRRGTMARGPRLATLMEFCAPSTFWPERIHSTPVCQHRVRSALRVLHPLDGLLLARTPSLVSCR